METCQIVRCEPGRKGGYARVKGHVCHPRDTRPETHQLMSHSQTYSMPTRAPMVHQYMERFWTASRSFRTSALYVAKDGRRNANQALKEE